jgi:hypothetical protein
MVAYQTHAHATSLEQMKSKPVEKQFIIHMTQKSCNTEYTHTIHQDRQILMSKSYTSIKSM